MAKTESALDIALAIRSGQRSALSVVQQTLAAIAEHDPALNAFTQVLADEAITQAHHIDRIVAGGGDPGPLCGVPFAVKNLFDVRGVVTLAGSRINASLPPAASDATAVSRLKQAGGVLVGCLNMDEYAYGFTTENSHYGATRNPHDTTRVAGGSSGGSAAAVAAGLVPLSLGSDTNGSIRVPAALCGIYGLKPTFGRLSRHGVAPFVHSLDHVGHFARTVADLALAYDVLQGANAADPCCSIRNVEPVSSALNDNAGSARAAVLGGWFTRNSSPAVAQAVQQVAAALGTGNTVQLPLAEAARAAAFCLTSAEGGALHLTNLRQQPQNFDPATRDRLMAGALLPSRWVLQAQRLRRVFLDSALALFEHHDVLIAAATPFQATPIGQTTIQLGEAQLSVRANLGLYTQPISFIGLPVLTVPVVVPGHLPCGVQLIAAPWCEQRLFQVAAQLEKAGIVGPAAIIR